MSGQEAQILSSARALCKIAVFSKSIPSREFKMIRQFEKRQSQPGLNTNQIHKWNCTSFTLTDESIDSSMAFSLSQDSLSLILYTKIITLLFHTGIKMLLTLHIARFQWAEGYLLGQTR